MLGGKVGSLVNTELQQVGNYQVLFHVNGLSSGVYVYQSQTETQTFAHKMVHKK